MLVCILLCRLMKVLCIFNSFFIKSSFLDYAGLRVKMFVKRLDLPELNWYLLQKSALLGTVSILKQVLQLSGAGCTRTD